MKLVRGPGNEVEIKELTEKVVFRAFNNKVQPVVRISPCEDQTGKLFTGQGIDGYYESLSEEDKRKMSYVVDRSIIRTIQDGKTLNPNAIIDREDWRWMQLHPYVVLDKSKGSSSRDATFYIEDRASEAAARVKASKDRDKARYLIQFELSYEQQLNVARVIGHPAPQGFKPVELQDYLLSQAEVIAAAVLSAADPKKSEENAVQVTFHELLRWKIIEKHVGGVYRFGGKEGISLGHNEVRVASWLSDPNHQETVAAILAQLDEKKKQLDVVPVQ